MSPRGARTTPSFREDHAGLAGALQLLRPREGGTVGHMEVPPINRLISDPRDIRVLQIRYGIIRAQALTPRESPAYVEKVQGET
ncbi:Scr1 family TA system antitoxin-like transcriptional regulator [Streptomyces sp. NPDC006967]|uniref:Scr1 family TA system antitoxin-like transcriptional regulator n=1 Tax=Streptomyces sp. NPDC006967 TaxID=3156906 RepID=UPI0033E06718